MCYELDPENFFSPSGLAWEVTLKTTEVKLKLLTDVDMLLMDGKGIRGGLCHSVNKYTKGL